MHMMQTVSIRGIRERGWRDDCGLEQLWRTVISKGEAVLEQRRRDDPAGKENHEAKAQTTEQTPKPLSPILKNKGSQQGRVVLAVASLRQSGKRKLHFINVRTAEKCPSVFLKSTLTSCLVGCFAFNTLLPPQTSTPVRFVFRELRHPQGLTTPTRVYS